MQYSDPNAGLFGNDSPYGNAGLPYTMEGRPGRRFRRTRRGCLGCLLPILVLAVIFWLLTYGWGLTITWGPTVVKVGADPTLVLENVSNPHAQIHIHAGENAGQIVILAPHVLPFGLPESYQATGDHQTIIYDLSVNTSGLFDITVPAQTNLKIDNNDTAIEVDGITGHMSIVSISGTLIVRNSTLIGPSLLRNDNGEIQATQDHLSGSVTLDNNSGGITFQSTLDPAGSYRFTGNGGPISLILPLNAALHINASTINGPISSNIPGVKVQATSSGAVFQANVGTAPRAQLTLYNNKSSITVNEQGGI